MVQPGLFGQHDDQGAWSVDALDPAELDVARGARAADECDRAHGIQQCQAFRDAFHDIGYVHDAYMDVGHERDDASPAGGSGVEHDGAGLSDCYGGTGDHRVDLVECGCGCLLYTSDAADDLLCVDL